MMLCHYLDTVNHFLPSVMGEQVAGTRVQDPLVCHELRLHRDSKLLVDTLDEVVAKMQKIPDRALINLQQDTSFEVSQNVMKLGKIVNKFQVLVHTYTACRKPN